MLRTKKLTTIAQCLLLFCCILFNNSHCATPSTIAISQLTPYIPVTTTIGLVELASNTTVYANQTIGAAAKIEASATMVSKVSGITISGTLDGSHENSVTYAHPPLPALLIGATKSNTTSILDIDNLTIDTTGNLTSANTATVLIDTPVKGAIHNHGSITGDTCVQVGDPANLTDFLLDGSLTNKGLISTNKPNGKLLVLAGKKTANVDSFSVYNFGRLSGSMLFEADDSDFKYRLENINYMVKYSHYTPGDRNDGVIEAATLEVKNTDLTIYNEHMVEIDNLKVQATKKTFLHLHAKNNVFSNIYPTAVARKLAHLTIKNSLENSNLGVITTEGTVTINKLINHCNGIVTFKDSNINLQEATNSGYMHALQKLNVHGVFTNSAQGNLNVNGILTFNKKLDNSGTITAKQALKINAPADNSGQINALHGLHSTGLFHNRNGVVEVSSGSSTFVAVVNNEGTIILEKSMIDFSKKVNNSGNIIAKNGIVARDLLVNQQSATLSISGNIKAHINSLTNDGVVYCRDTELKLLSRSENKGLIDAIHGFDATDFTNQQGATLTVKGMHATFSKNFINKGYINSAAHVSTQKAKNSGVIIATAGMHAKSNFWNAARGKLTVSGGDLIFTKSLHNDGSITTIDHQLELQQSSVNTGFIDAKYGVESSQAFTNGDHARLLICNFVDIQGTADIASIKYFPFTIGKATINKLIVTKDPSGSGRSLNFAGQTEIYDLINSTKIISKDKLTLTEMSNSGEIIAKGKLEFTKEATNMGLIEAHKGLAISAGTLTNKQQGILNVSGGNFQVDAFLNNSGAISSAESACFLKEVTNSGIIQANFGLHAHEKLTNSLTGRLIVKAKPLSIHGDLVNNGTITSEKQVSFNNPVLNNGVIQAQLDLSINASVTNSKQAHILVGHGLLTITGTTDNSGSIEANESMHAKSYFINQKDAQVVVNTEQLIFTEVSNSGNITANNGVLIKKNLHNRENFIVKGDELKIVGFLDNSGAITSEKAVHFSKDISNSGYIEGNAGLAVDGVLANTGNIVVNKGKLIAHGRVYNSGGIISVDCMDIRGNTKNYGYIKADSGLTVESSTTFLNGNTATLVVNGGVFLVASNLVNLGTMTAEKATHFTNLASNNGYFECKSSLTIDGSFTNQGEAIVKGENLTVNSPVINYGTITSAGWVSFKEEATNHGCFIAQSGLTIANSKTFLNAKRGMLAVSGRELFLATHTTNDGTITAKQATHIAKSLANNGYFRADDSLTIDGSFTNTGKAIIKGNNLTTHKSVVNSGTIISDGLVNLEKEVYNYGDFIANSGLTIADSKIFLNGSTATLSVDGGELVVASYGVNHGTITSGKSVHFTGAAINEGYFDCKARLTINGSFTNVGRAIVQGKNLTIHSPVINYGTITSAGWVSFKEEATNYGCFIARDGLTIANSKTFINGKAATLLVAGREMFLATYLVNDGSITTEQSTHIAKAVKNRGYFEALHCLTIDGSLNNTGEIIVKGANLTVHNPVDNYGTITSDGWVNFKEDACNYGLLIANSGLTIARTKAFFNGVTATLSVKGRELFLASPVINKGLITSEKSVHIAKSLDNAGSFKTCNCLTIDGYVNNTGLLEVKGVNLTVHSAVNNSGTIASDGWVNFKEDAHNYGLLIAKSGLTIAQNKTFFNGATATLSVTGRELFLASPVINHGLITSEESTHIAKSLDNAGSFKTSNCLTIDGYVNNTGLLEVKGANLTVHNPVSNYGTITSAGWVNFKEDARNYGYLFANSGLTVAHTKTFHNERSATLRVKGRELFIASDLINRGTITSNKTAHCVRSVVNEGYFEVDLGLTINGTFTNTANTIVNGKKLEVQGVANNSGSITCAGLVSFKEQVNNDGYIKANFGLVAVGLNTFTNTKNANVFVRGRELNVNGNLINAGSITSLNSMHFIGMVNNNGAINAKACLTIDGSFTNTASVIVEGANLTAHESVYNSGTITSAGWINFKEQSSNYGYIKGSSGFVVASSQSFINAANAIINVSGRELSINGEVNNFGTITSTNFITFNKGVNNSGVIVANNGIITDGTVVNTSNGNIIVCNDVNINGLSSMEGMSVLSHGCSIGTATISNFAVTGNRSVVFFGPSHIDKLTNVGDIRANKIFFINEASNSGKILADNNITFVKSATNSGVIIANEDLMLFEENLYNSGILKAKSGLTVIGTLTNLNNASIRIYDAIVIENTATILGVNKSSSSTISFATSTIAKLTNKHKTHINFNADSSVITLLNDGNIIADAKLSLGELSNTGVVTATKGLIVNATATNVLGASILVEGATASFNACVGNFGRIEINNTKLSINSSLFNAGKIIANTGFSITGKFTNKESLIVSGGEAIFADEVDNSSIIESQKLIRFEKKLVNSGNIQANNKLQILFDFVNDTNGKLFGSEFEPSSFNIIDNSGFIAVAAGSDAKYYLGRSSSELQITMPSKDPASALFKVIHDATLTSNAKLIVDSHTDLNYLQKGKKITLIKAKNLYLADGVNDILHRYLKTKSYFISISEAVIIDNSIEATIRQDINKVLNLTDRTSKVANSLIKKQVVNVQQVKEASEMPDDVKLSYVDKNILVLDKIREIITRSDIKDIDINSIREEINAPNAEIYTVAEAQNKITSNVNNKLQTDKKQSKYWKKHSATFNKKDHPDVLWLLASYHQGKDRGYNNNGDYSKYIDKIICVGAKHEVALFDVGFSIAYTHSNINKYRDVDNHISTRVDCYKQQGLIILLHAIRELTGDFNVSVSFSYGKTRHQLASSTNFINRSYSAAMSANYEVHINDIEVELGLTSRIVHIYTPEYKIADQNNMVLQNGNSDYFSLGPVVSVSFNHKVNEKFGVSLEGSIGYLHTFSTNKTESYTLTLADTNFDMTRGSYYKNSLYIITKMHFFYDSMFWGVDFNFNRDATKNIYGVNLFLGFRYSM